MLEISKQSKNQRIMIQIKEEIQIQIKEVVPTKHYVHSIGFSKVLMHMGRWAWATLLPALQPGSAVAARSMAAISTIQLKNSAPKQTVPTSACCRTYFFYLAKRGTKTEEGANRGQMLKRCYEENGDDSSAEIWLVGFSSQLLRLLSVDSDFDMYRALLWNFWSVFLWPMLM